MFPCSPYMDGDFQNIQVFKNQVYKCLLGIGKIPEQVEL